MEIVEWLKTHWGGVAENLVATLIGIIVAQLWRSTRKSIADLRKWATKEIGSEELARAFVEKLILLNHPQAFRVVFAIYRDYFRSALLSMIIVLAALAVHSVLTANMILSIAIGWAGTGLIMAYIGTKPTIKNFLTGHEMKAILFQLIIEFLVEQKKVDPANAENLDTAIKKLVAHLQEILPTRQSQPAGGCKLAQRIRDMSRLPNIRNRRWTEEELQAPAMN
jgi:hypothetical protein